MGLTKLTRLHRIGETIEYAGAAYVGGKPLAGRKGKIVEVYRSPTGRNMITVDFGRTMVLSMPDPGPYFLVERDVRTRSKKTVRRRDPSRSKLGVLPSKSQLLERAMRHLMKEFGTDYGRREIDSYRRHMRGLEKEPLRERQKDAAEFFMAMANEPRLVAERVGWLLDGSYGRGAFLKAKQVLLSPRMNRVAALTQMAGALEWRSTPAFTAKAWNKLTPAQKTALQVVVGAEVEQAEREEVRHAQSGMRDPNYTKRHFDEETKLVDRSRTMSASQYKRETRKHVPAWIVDPLAKRKPGSVGEQARLRKMARGGEAPATPRTTRGTWVHTLHGQYYMPEREIKKEHDTYVYVPMRGYMSQLAVFDKFDHVIGWINTRVLGYGSAKEWMTGVKWKDGGY